MEQKENQSYEFGRFRLNTAERVLLREGEPVPLNPEVFDILVVFVENGGEFVEKEDLMRRVWPNTFVEEGNLLKTFHSYEKRSARLLAESSLLRLCRDVATGLSPKRMRRGVTRPRPATRIRSVPSARSGNYPSGCLVPNTTGQLARFRRIPVFVVVGVVVIGFVGLMYLTGWSKSGNASAIQSIAVLPFVDESADPTLNISTTRLPRA